MLRRAVELGVNFIDTADSYGPGVSETLIAEALYPYPDDLVIATKGGLERPGPGPWPANGRPEHLKQACEGSLQRLRLEQIPLYQLHRPDPEVALEESVGALVELRDQGKIRHIGLSNVSEEQLRRAQRLTAVVSVQNRYNLGDRASDPLIDLCEQERLAFLPWEPIQRLRPPSGPVADRPAARCRPAAGRAGLAAGPLSRGAADPRHRHGRAPGAQRRRGGAAAERRGGRCPEHRRQSLQPWAVARGVTRSMVGPAGRAASKNQTSGPRQPWLAPGSPPPTLARLPDVRGPDLTAMGRPVGVTYTRGRAAETKKAAFVTPPNFAPHGSV